MRNFCFLWTVAAVLPVTGMADEIAARIEPPAKKELPTATAVVIETKKAVVAVESKPATAEPDATQKLKSETEKITAQKDKLLAEAALAQAKLDSELAQSKEKTLRLQTQLAELKAQQELQEFQKKTESDLALAEQKSRLEKVTIENSIVKAETETETMHIRRIENSTKKDAVMLSATMELEQVQAKSRQFAGKQPVYLKEPLDGKRLVLSDRRVALNGVIGMKTADEIVAQINYYNNRDRELPIFIVIDDSPGGSVMAGYKILKAMQGSEAPVYVVVKSFAASMAACITTLAERSFAYPNAVIMHHQIASLSGGNLTQQQEWVREMEEWWKRLAGPVADKMGITREEFIKRMYERSSSGDWNEFADQAQKLKWVDVVVDEIQETGTLRHPSEAASESGMLATAGQSETEVVAATRDNQGRPYMMLPRLNPMDCYWLYNPDGYYRAP